ncbi:hypothetical protein E2C01_018063 [Portunus trituberculatus]|uniref:Secreted protein n=1 Tax=Portunus trituberculatus TaxID=210409 RepID=A0A5B7DU39_PORTR|nr:hypothetical protein [Portunus trituberculatus]
MLWLFVTARHRVFFVFRVGGVSGSVQAVSPTARFVALGGQAAPERQRRGLCKDILCDRHEVTPECWAPQQGREARVMPEYP